MDAGGPVDDMGLIDMDCEGDSLLQMVDCQPDLTLSHAFSPAAVSSDKHDLRLKLDALKPLPGDNSICQSKCLSPNGDDKENLPMVMDDSIGSSLVSEDPQQEKKRKKAKGFNIRKSIAWHRAFSTEEGVLDASELSIFNCSFSHSTNAKLPTVNEVEDTSQGGDSLGSSDLQPIKEEISNESHKKKPQLQDKKPTVSSSIKSTSLKMKNAPALNKTSTARRVDQIGACSQPPHPNSQRSQILGKTVRSMSGTQKQKVAKPGLTMSSTNPTLDGKHLKSMDKDTVQKHFAAKGRAGTNIQAAPGRSTKHPGKSSTRNFSMKAKDSEEKSKKPQSRQGLGISKASSRMKNVDNHIDKNAGQLSSASSPCSSVATSVGNSILNRQAGGNSTLHLSGISCTGATRKDTHNTDNTMQNPALQDTKSELSAVSCSSKLGLPVYQDTKCTIGNILPTHHAKPSALKMPSPTLGFFGQAKAFGAHIQAPKCALEAGSSSHGSSSVKATRLPQVRNLSNGCLPPSAKISKPTSAIVGAVTFQIRPYSSYKNSTEADLPKPILEANVPGKLKIETPVDPEEQINNENDVRILMETHLETGNVLSEEKHGNDKSVDETMLTDKYQHKNRKVVDTDQSLKPVGSRSPNEEKHHDDENSYKDLLIDNDSGVQNDKPLHFVNTGNDSKHDSMAFLCSRSNQMSSIGYEVLIESMPVEICDAQCGCESAIGKPLANNQSMASGLSPKKPIEICNPIIDKKRQDSEETPFNGSIAVDSGHASERKKLRRSSGSTFDGCLEATSNEVVDMVTEPSDFQEYAKSLCTTTTGEGTTNDDQEKISGFVAIEDKSLQEIDLDIMRENGSHLCRKSAEDLLVSLPADSPTSEEQTVADRGSIDNKMNDEVEQTARASDNSVDNNSMQYKCKTINQDVPLLGCSSSSLPQDIEVATPHTVHAVDEEFANIDCHGSTNEWINSEKNLHSEEEMGDSQLSHLMVDPPSGMTGELASCVEITQAVDRECYRSDYGANHTSEKTREFPTSRGDFKVVGEAAQGDMEHSTSAAQGPTVSN
ncbi:uncharacterized protein LOC116254087 isoform X2 [Nymphaea colorata]|nr:uncharacterized protein LOC116254087 isoform X2 [Nymphaea colorata]